MTIFNSIQIGILHFHSVYYFGVCRNSGMNGIPMDRYMKDFRRVQWLKNDGRDIHDIVFFTRMSESLVKEYLCHSFTILYFRTVGVRWYYCLIHSYTGSTPDTDPPAGRVSTTALSYYSL
jgi:hypothetical protein